MIRHAGLLSNLYNLYIYISMTYKKTKAIIGDKSKNLVIFNILRNFWCGRNRTMWAFWKGQRPGFANALQPNKTQAGLNWGGRLTWTHKGKACQCKTGIKLLSGRVFKIDTGWKWEFSFLIWSPPKLRQNPSTITAAVKNVFLFVCLFLLI